MTARCSTARTYRLRAVGIHRNTTSLVYHLVTSILAGYQLVEVYQLKAGIMSLNQAGNQLVISNYRDLAEIISPN